MFLSNLFKRCPATGRIIGINGRAWPKWSLFFVGLVATAWYLIRVIPKPSRAGYPCQRAIAPISIGFIVYCGALFASAFSYAKGRSFLRKKRYWYAALCLGISMVSMLVFIGSDSKPAFAASGTAKGIYPGRVAWVYNSNAAKWTGSGNYWDASVNSQAEYDKSFTAGINALSGGTNDASSWNLIFRWFNNSHGRAGTGYQNGDKIAIKINQNNTANPGGGTNQSNANPQTCAAVVRSLLNAGVPAGDIYIGDPSRAVTDNIYNAVKAVNGGINVVDYQGTNGRVDGKPTTVVNFNMGGLNNKISTIFYNARYIICQPLLKGHGGVPTFGGKNFFGITGLSNNYVNNAHPGNNAWGLLMYHQQVGAKVVLWCMDAMYPNYNLDGVPSAKVNVPVINQNTQLSSLIMSLDGVADECVSADMLSATVGFNGDNSYIQYASNNGGGVYDRWDANRTYAKNRDPNANGIELVLVRPDQNTPGTLAFSGGSYSVNENGGSATITVRRTNGSSGQVGISYATSNGSATAGADYTSASGTLTFAAGVTSQSFTVPILNDNSVEGSETVTLTLTNATGGASLGSPSTATLTIVDDDQGRISLPGRIQAESYNNGGEGVGYHDADAVNSGGQYRTDGVDIEVCTDAGGGYDVGYTAAGEWLAYNVNVSASGQYTLTARMASGTAGTKTMTVTLDGATIGTFTTTDASGWQSWRDVVVSNINMTAGDHTLRMNMTTGGFNLNYLNVATQGVVTGISLPGRIQAEDYNTGGEGVGYHDVDAGNTGGVYRTDGVDIQACTDAGGGYNVGWTAAGEWLAYNVNVSASGQYTLTARMASGNAGTKTMTVTLDGATIGTFSTTDASGWQSWKDVVVSNVNLTAGNHALRMNITAAGFNLNYLNVATQGPALTDIARGKTATASSVENATNVAANAVDGNSATRWSSAYSDPQWITVDLGATYAISAVVLNWEAASAKNYTIRRSTDNVNWTTMSTQVNMAAGARKDSIPGLSGSGRYIQMNGTARNTVYGYSLWDFRVYGSAASGGAPPAPTAMRMSRIVKTDWNLDICNFSNGIAYFTLPKAGTYNLSAFTLAGKQTPLAVHKSGVPGPNTVQVSLSRGVYILRLTTPDGGKVDKKVNILR